MAVLLYLGRHTWFFYDEWDFIARAGGHSSLGLLIPHNEHWSTIPILLYRLIYSVVGLRTYLPYLALPIVAHVVLVHLIWRCMRREGVDEWLATFLAGAVLFMGAGYQNLFWAFQIGFVGALACGFAAFLLMDVAQAVDGVPPSTRFASFVGPRPRRFVAGQAIMVCGLMFSGLGPYVVFIATVAILIRHGWRRAVAVMTIPAAVFIAWFVAIGRFWIHDSASGLQLLSVPVYAWVGLTNAAEGFTGWTGSGPVVILGLAGLMLHQRNRALPHAGFAYASALGAVLFFLVGGVGRISLGADQAQASRYVYTAVVLLIAGCGVVVTSMLGDRWANRAIALAVIALIGAQGVGVLVLQARNWAGMEQADRARLAITDQLLRSHSVILGNANAQIDPIGAPQLTVGEVRDLERDGALPPPDHVARQRVDVLSVEQHVQLSLTAYPVLSDSAGARLLATSSLTASADGSCVVAMSLGGASRLALRLDGVGSLGITTEAGGDVVVYVVDPVDNTEATGPRSFHLVAGGGYLNVGFTDAAVVLSLPAGSARICNVSTR